MFFLSKDVKTEILKNINTKHEFVSLSKFMKCNVKRSFFNKLNSVWFDKCTVDIFDSFKSWSWSSVHSCSKGTRAASVLACCKCRLHVYKSSLKPNRIIAIIVIWFGALEQRSNRFSVSLKSVLKRRERQKSYSSGSFECHS